MEFLAMRLHFICCLPEEESCDVLLGPGNEWLVIEQGAECWILGAKATPQDSPPGHGINIWGQSQKTCGEHARVITLTPNIV
jgi:hypothetical protein